MSSTSKNYSFDSGNIKKIMIFFGLIFAQISNFFFWLEEAIPIEEFFIFDMFLIFSLFFIILKEHGTVSSNNIIANYTCLLGAVNNFFTTLFFLCWGIFFPEKDLTFVTKIGLNGDFQILFDFISLVTLRFIYLKYKNIIGGLNTEKIILSEVILIIALASTLLII